LAKNPFHSVAVKKAYCPPVVCFHHFYLLAL
jgi:hypothetical protein